MKNFIIKNNKSFFFILGIITIFFIWFLLGLRISNSIALPTIKETFTALGELLKKGETYLILLRTIGRLLMTVLLSLVITLILVGLSTLSSRFASFISPLISLLKTLPVAVIIIFLLVALGSKQAPFYITTLVVLPIMYEAIYSGINNIDTSLKEEVRMFTNTNILVIRKVYLPLSFPYIVLSIFQSIGLGLKVMIMAEFIAQSPSSIGYEMSWYKSVLSMDYVFAWAVIMVGFVIFMEILIKKVKVGEFL